MSLTEILGVVLLYFLFAALIATRKSSYVQGRTIYLFRALFPSWRFFEEICEIPTLYYRTETADGDFGPWIECLEKLERSWKSLFLNPQGNLHMAFGSLLHQLENDIAEQDEDKFDLFINSTSYKLTENLVRSQLLKKGALTGENFQFKVASVRQGSTEILEDNLISITHQI